MDLREQSAINFNNLKDNNYPGRGIVLGMTPNGENLVQVYWIMGRSENSRNRIFKEDNGFVKTEAFDSSKLTDPSLIIYYPVKNKDKCHIVTNGDQTDTIYEQISLGKTFEDAMNLRTFEPDAPNFTPRISGIMNLDQTSYCYKLAILKSIANDGIYTQKNIYNYQKAIPGYGHMITTYKSDGNPLPSFSSDPLPVPVLDDGEELADMYWKALDNDNKVSLLTKVINIATGEFKFNIKNKLIETEEK